MTTGDPMCSACGAYLMSCTCRGVSVNPFGRNKTAFQIMIDSEKEELTKATTPIGVTPAFIWKERRVRELLEASQRYVGYNHSKVCEWLQEALDILQDEE